MIYDFMPSFPVLLKTLSPLSAKQPPSRPPPPWEASLPVRHTHCPALISLGWSLALGHISKGHSISLTSITLAVLVHLPVDEHLHYKLCWQFPK